MGREPPRPPRPPPCAIVNKSSIKEDGSKNAPSRPLQEWAKNLRARQDHHPMRLLTKTQSSSLIDKLTNPPAPPGVGNEPPRPPRPPCYDISEISKLKVNKMYIQGLILTQRIHRAREGNPNRSRRCSSRH